MEAPNLRHMLSGPMAEVCHVGHKWIAPPSSSFPTTAMSASPALAATWCITPALVETAACVPVLVGDCHTVNWWDIEGRSCNRRGGLIFMAAICCVMTV